MHRPNSSGRSPAGALAPPKSTAIHASVPASSAPTNHAVDGAADAIASDRAREQDAARAAGRLEQQRKEVHVLAVLRPGSAADALHALAQ